MQPHTDSRLQVRKDSATRDQSAAALLNGNQGKRHTQSPTSFSSTRRIESSTREQNTKPVDEIKNLSPPPSDALQRARAAISAAERATAAARAAAELVNARFTPFKLEERKT